LITRLSSLYELQLVDEQLDELEELRGDLPAAVNELSGTINGLKSSVDAKEKEKQSANDRQAVNEEEKDRLSDNLKRYKAQLYQVRNNKEYDALTKEIDSTEEMIKKLDTENLQLTELIIKLEDEIKSVTPQLDTLLDELKVKEADLKQIIKANEREEQKLREVRERIVEKVKKPDYATYTRIRKAKGGRAVVPIVRGSCDGCHNIIPPQRQIEIKSNKRIFNCEACGRIIISQEIAEAVTSK
jgi:predicted  nucleic acid-binding Zn-ribbon protein